MGRRSSIDGRLRTLMVLGLTHPLDDLSLLSLYLEDRDGRGDEAFRLLVERHGPMVFRVCRPICGDVQDAEDATQAVFLVLARKAGSLTVWGKRSIAPWLHGVARRVAAKARCRGALRRKRDARIAEQASALRAAHANDQAIAIDAEVIHEEVGRLAEKYRTPVVLCYLQGLTYDQAAEQIGCPVGTVRVRLSRARDRLRTTLERRGLGPDRLASVGLWLNEPGAVVTPLTTVLMETALFNAALVDGTVRTIRALAIGRGVVDATVASSVVSLYQGVLRTMMIKRLMLAMACLLAIGLTGAGAIQFAKASPGDQATWLVSLMAQAQGEREGKKQDPQPKPEPPQAKALTLDYDDPATLRKWLGDRLDTARTRWKSAVAFYEEGKITIDRLIDASRQLMLAELAVSPSREERLKTMKANWDRITTMKEREQSELDTGRGTFASLSEVRAAEENAAYEYIEARQSPSLSEIETLKARVKNLEERLNVIQPQPENSDPLSKTVKP